MIHRIADFDPGAPIIVFDVGNTATHVATWHENNLKTPLGVDTGDDAAIKQSFEAHVDAMPNGRVAAVVIGSVVKEATGRIADLVQTALDRRPLVIGDAIPLPMDVAVTDASAVGVDRVCAAYAVFDRLQTGCICVDFGTAVTVDLVDDGGVFLGGAILPGIRLQLATLSEHTSALPLIEPGVPELPYGRDTTEAIQAGVCRGIAGAVRELVEGYASHLNRWPQVVASGGDAAFMKPFVDFIDTFVTDITLRGIGLAYSKHLRDLGA